MARNPRTKQGGWVRTVIVYKTDEAKTWATARKEARRLIKRYGLDKTYGKISLPRSVDPEDETKSTFRFKLHDLPSRGQFGQKVFSDRYGTKRLALLYQTVKGRKPVGRTEKAKRKKQKQAWAFADSARKGSKKRHKPKRTILTSPW